MRKWKCSACGATYLDPQPDGSAYYHACAEIPNVAFQPDPAKANHDPRETVKLEGHRDENLLPGLNFVGGKFMRFTTDPNDSAVTRAELVEQIQISPGAGRVKVDA